MKKIKLAKTGDGTKQEAFDPDHQDNEEQEEEDDIDVGSSSGLAAQDIKFEPAEESSSSSPSAEKFHMPQFTGLNFSFPVLTKSNLAS